MPKQGPFSEWRTIRPEPYCAYRIAEGSCESVTASVLYILYSDAV